MVNVPLDMKYVYTRDRYLEKRKSLNEGTNVMVPELYYITDSNLLKSKVYSFMESCYSYKDSIKMLENLYESNNFDLLEYATTRMESEIIPTIPSNELDNCKDLLSKSNIGQPNIDRLSESLSMYKSIDRIRKNHKNLTKRFSTLESSYKYKSDKDKCYFVCEMVDTYSLSNYIKFNIVLEELTYLNNITGSLIDESNMVKYVTDYFLLRENLSNEDIDSYRLAIKNSKVITENSDTRIQYLMNTNSDVIHTNHWKDKINEWKLSTDRNLEELSELARTYCYDLTSLKSILEVMSDYSRINGLKFNILEIFDINNIQNIDSEGTRNIINIIRENNITDDSDTIDTLLIVQEADLNNLSYQDDKIDEDPQTFSSDKIDKFMLHDLISDAQDTGEFLNQLEKTSMKESPFNVKKILTSKEKITENNICDYIDDNNHISIKLASYSFDGTYENIIDLVENSVDCINNILYNRNSKAYYTLFEDHFDISIRSKYYIHLTEAEESSRGFTQSDKELICNIHQYTEALEKLYRSPISEILEKMNDGMYASEISIDEATLLYDILSPYIDRENNIMDDFIKECSYEGNSYANDIKRECSYIKLESFDPYEDHLERLNFCAYQLMGLSEAKNNQNQNNNAVNNNDTSGKIKNNKHSAKNNSSIPDNSNMEDDKKKKKKLTLNDIKLAWQGVKAKLKQASAKEKEISRDIDLQFNHLCNSIEQSTRVDHREELITGEVNRSLSKIIKMGIAFAGLGSIGGGVTAAIGGVAKAKFIGAGALIAPAIAAVVAFAKSKHVTDKERKLLIDEIDIELQILEREISRAEQSGSTQKYRQLLTIQKNLQRKRQELYYDLARKGHKIPMQATVGLRSRE